jgi:hypothetical protein
MGIQFNLDGSITNTPDPTEQEQLEARVVNFENIKQRRFDELRNYRNNLLIRSDWTIVNDSPLPVGIQSSWREYRQNLRDLPNQSNAPDRFLIAEWPLSPEQTEIPDDAKIFVAEISDPLGIGTTSWVGIGTNGEYVDQLISS